MSAAVLMNPPSELDQKALTIADKAKVLKVVDQQSYDVAVEELKGVVALRKQITEHHAPLKAKAHEAHKAICDAENKLLKPVADAERLIKTSIAGFEAEQRRIAAEQERKAREEQERLAAEEIEAAAVEAEQQGATAEEVKAIIEQPVIVPRVEVQPTFQKASGVSVSQQWKAEVVNIKQLCLAIGKGEASINLVAPNMTALNQMARAMKHTFNIPGCKAVPVDNIRVGGR